MPNGLELISLIRHQQCKNYLNKVLTLHENHFIDNKKKSMKKLLQGLSFLLAIAIFAVSCSKDDNGNDVVYRVKRTVF